MIRNCLILSLHIFLLTSCNQQVKNVPEPNYNPHLLRPEKSLPDGQAGIPTMGKVINMDSVAKPKFIPIKGRFVKGGKPKSIPVKSNFHPTGKAKSVPARGKVVDMDAVAPPRKLSAKGKKVRAGWPKWEPAQLYYKDNSIIAYLNVDQGLNTPFIPSLLEDRFGRIWIGNIDGTLIVWDGKGLNHYAGIEGLNGNWIGSLMEDQLGRIWIGTQGGGLMCWDGSQFIHYTQEGGLLDNLVLSLMEDSTGRIWIGTLEGVNVWDGVHFTQYTIDQGLGGKGVNSLLEDREGRIWIGTNEGLSVWAPDSPASPSGGPMDNDKQGSFTNYTDQQGLSSNDINCLMEDREGNIWIGTPDGISVWKQNDSGVDGIFTHYTTQEGLSNNGVISLLEDSQGKVWIGTGLGGINIWENYNGTNGFTHYAEAEGLSNIGAWSLLEDRYGRIWIGTIGGGITIWDADNAGTTKKISHYSTAEGLSHNNIWALLVDRAGRIWAGTQGGGVSVWENTGFGESITHYTTTEGLSGNQVEALMQDRDGRIWIGTRGGGACVWDEKLGGFTHYTEAEGLSSNTVLSILEDRDGNIWLGTHGGLYVLQKKAGGPAGGFIHYTTAEGLSHNRVSELLEDRNGRIWIGSQDRGASVWDPTQGETEGFTHFTTTEGLSGSHVFSLAEDFFGHIWMGTPGQGANVWISNNPDTKSSGDKKEPNGRIIQYTKDQGLSKNSIRSLLSGLKDEHWIGTYGGLNRLSWIEQEQEWGIRQFSKPDGLIGLSIYGMQIDQQERLWLGTSQGLSRIALSSLKADTIRPVLLFRELQPFFEFVDWRTVKDSLPSDIDFDSVLAYSNMPLDPVFSHNYNDLTFHWSGIHGAATPQLQYSYFLEGNDKNWSPLIKENSLRFQNLMPGAYTFKLRAVGRNSQWSETATYSFSIRPPWWQSTLAYIMYILLAVSSIWGFLQWRTATLRKRQKALEQAVTERTAEVVAEQQRSNELLLNILPAEVARELKEAGKTSPVFFEDVSILFADFMSYTTIVASIPGKVLVQELDDIFKHYDDIMESIGLEKIQTIGDAYLAACGLPTADPEHAIKCVRAGRQIIAYLDQRNQTNSIKWKVRIGIHSGPVTAGVIGKKKFSYDIFGDTVNIAARVETSGEAGKINISAYTHLLIKEQFNCTYRGKIDAKGKGELDMYFVD